MMRFGLAALAAALFATTAYSADMAVKAQPAPVYGAPMSWAGFYLEGYGLYGANLSHLKDLDIGGATFGDLASNPHGPGIGGAIGYNIQLPNSWVLGARLELAYANMQGGSNLAQALSFSNATNYLGSFNALVGIPLTADGRLLGYGTGGFAFGGAKPNLTVVGLAPTQIQAAANDTSTGWDIGAGLAYKITQNVSIFMEGDYYRLGDKSLSATIGGVPVVTATVPYNIFTQKFGLNLHF